MTVSPMARWSARTASATTLAGLAPDETVIPLHPHVPLLGVSTGLKQGVSSKMTFCHTPLYLYYVFQ